MRPGTQAVVPCVPVLYVQVLGGGIDVVTIGVRTYIRSVPGEFNLDKSKVMELAQQQGCISTGGCGFALHAALV
jgi:hypothetical protein